MSDVNTGQAAGAEASIDRTGVAARADRRPQGLRRGRRAGRRARRRLHRLRRRRVHRRDGAVRVREVHAHALHGRARHRDRRPGLARRRRPVAAQRQAADPAAPRQDRLRLPGVQPGADADGEENIVLPLAIAGRKPDQEWFDTVIDTVGLAGPAQPPAERALRRAAAAGRLCARAGRHDPRSSSPTSRPATSTRTSGAEVLGFLRRSVDEYEQTIVMVTHDPVAAAYTDRVVFLADGKVVDELRQPDRRRRCSSKMNELSLQRGRRHRRRRPDRHVEGHLAQPDGAQAQARPQWLRDRPRRRVRRWLVHLHRRPRRVVQRHRQGHDVRRRGLPDRGLRLRRGRRTPAPSPPPSLDEHRRRCPRSSRRTASRRSRAST